MQSAYVIRLGLQLAIADLCKADGSDRMYITRINVPPAFRGQGHGSTLLQMVCDDADREGVTLYLVVNPSGDLGVRQLYAWYRRYGFKSWRSGIQRRLPQGTHQKGDVR